MTVRILVTGSRQWDDADRIALVLKGVREQPHFSTAVLVHGGARGADLLAAKAWADMGGRLHLYRAKWEQCARTCPPGHRKKRAGASYCPTAGHRRNAAMVNDGADLCLAFTRNGSKGTAGCVSLAQRAGIPVLSFGYDRPADEGVWS